VDSTVPDVMIGLPASPAPDTAIPPAPGPAPGPMPPDTIGGGGTGGGGTVGGGGGGTGAGGGTGGSGFPGFMGEYLVDNEGVWFAVEGSQTNELVRSGGDCTADRATFDWAQFSCEAARFGYRLTMRLEPLGLVFGPPTPMPGGPEPLTGGDPAAGPQGEHTIAMTRNEVDGVRLTVVSWAPPPLPPPVPPGPEPPGPLPPDSTVTSQ